MAPNNSSFPGARAGLVLRLMRHEGRADPFPFHYKATKIPPGKPNPQGAPLDRWGRDAA